MEVPHPFHHKTEWQRMPQFMPSKAEENCSQVGSDICFKIPFSTYFHLLCLSVYLTKIIVFLYSLQLWSNIIVLMMYLTDQTITLPHLP